MNIDLISREALKEDFKSRLSICNGWIVNAKDKETKIRASAVKAFIAEVIMTIDNAPTVDLTKNQAYDKGFITAMKLYARPQGEWGKWVISEIRCPNCLEYFQTDCYSTEELKKCPNCGAKMKGGAE